MKKYFLLVAAALSAMVACQEKPETPIEDAKIVLSAPDDNSAVEATVDNDMTFSWTAAGETGDLELVFSLSSRLVNPQTVKIEGGSSITLSGREFMDKVIALGIEEGLETRIYWSVRPVAGKAETEVRTLKVTCSFPSIVLNTPDNLITIDGNAPAFPYEFSCVPVTSIEEYTLKFSLDDRFPADATVSYELTDGRWTMDEDRFYGLMDALGVRGSNTVDVYWTVTSADETLVVSTQTRTFTARKSALRNAVASWTFDDAANLAKAAVGEDMIFHGTVTAASSGCGEGNGAITVAAGKESWLEAKHGIAPNGGVGAKKINEYTILMDIRVPDAGWNALIHTDVDRGGNEASRIQLSGDDLGNGTCGLTYNGEWPVTGYPVIENHWHRIVVSSKCGVHWDAYVDGEYVLCGNVADYAQFESGWALEPEGVLFCADDNWVPSQLMDIAQITIWDEPLDASTIKALGTVSEY